ncbi:MAG: nitroreductase family protein [Christensenellales bacterium]|jgi:nitroreductase
MWWEYDKYTEARYRAIDKRRSNRTFVSQPQPHVLDELKLSAHSLSKAVGVRIAVIKGAEDIFSLLPGGYGTIKGDMAAAAIFCRKGDAFGSLKAGYAGEQLVLDATAMDVGTCWTAGTYSQAKTKKMVAMRDNEKLVCVTPLGIVAKDASTTERIIEKAASGRSRKTLETLTGMITQQLDLLPKWQRAALEAARIAPSAMNAQPWRFTVLKGGIRIEAVPIRLPLSEIDFGIAMLHMELAAAQHGVKTNWQLLNRPHVAEITAVK